MIKQLSITNYKTYFILGNNDCEKLNRHPVLLDINLRFVDDDVPACKSDDIKDTICYSHLLKFLEEGLKQQQFNLVERAAQYVYDVIFEYIKKTIPSKKIMIRVELVKPDSLLKEQGSSSFICSDW